jgi:hypothetical protein
MSEAEYNQVKSFMQQMKAPPEILEALHDHYQKNKMEQVIIQNPAKKRRKKIVYKYQNDQEITVTE